MFFKESESLAVKHAELKDLIEKIDGHLSQFDASAIARVADFATFSGEHINRISGLFDAYVSEGILQKVEIVECMKCQTLSNAVDYRSTSRDDEPFPCPACGEDLRAQLARQYVVHKLTAAALKRAARWRGVSQVPVTHIVLLIHGIRTTAPWQEMLAEELNAIPGVKAIPLGFEYLDVVRFWFPFWTRDAPVYKLLGKIRLAKSDADQAAISVIAHSFGTYSIFRILTEQPDLGFKRIILCGSIVSHDAPWATLKPRVEEEILNDCGTRDIWPVAARALSWFYGATGTFGFKSPGIRDRFHDLDHGGFFKEDFIRTYWLPFIADGKIVPSPWTRERRSSPWWLSFGASTLFRWQLGGALAFLLWRIWLSIA